jgi:hypothetical protein
MTLPHIIPNWGKKEVKSLVSIGCKRTYVFGQGVSQSGFITNMQSTSFYLKSMPKRLIPALQGMNLLLEEHECDGTINASGLSKRKKSGFGHLAAFVPRDHHRDHD